MFIRMFFSSSVALFVGAYSAYAANVDLYSAEQLEFKTENGIERVYTKTGEPFSGAVILPDVENRHTTYFYKQGQKNGVAASYAADETVMTETTYVDGKKNGVEKIYYANGNTQYQRNYKNDVIDGYEVLFHENGKPQKQSHYENGVLNGEVHYYDEDGNYYKTENYKNGIKNGVERIVKNKSLMAENNYVDGRLHGVSKKFDEKYLTDEIEYVDGIKEGLHIHYNADGSVEEIPYHFDMKNGTAELYADIKKKEQDKTYTEKRNIRTTTYADDKKNGFEQVFNPNNAPSAIKNYTADKLEGVSRYFDDENKLTAVKYFKDGVQTGAIDLNNDEKISQIYSRYNSGKIGPLLKQRSIWYRILWLAISIGDQNLLDNLEKAMKMYDFDIADMAVYKRFSGADFANQTENLFFGMTPFTYALSVSAPQEIIQKFIKQNREPNADGETPLHYAVRLNNPQYVGKILEFLPDVTDDEIADVLVYALENGIQPKIVETLLNKTHQGTADINGRSLLDYAMKNDASPDVMILLLKSGVDIKKNGGDTLLTEMLRQNKPVSYITVLLEENPDASGVDESEHSALYYAGINNYPQKIKEALQRAGASWSGADKQSILYSAVSLDDTAPLENSGISLQELSGINIENANALQYAYDIRASHKILQHLVDMGVDINHQDRNGSTLLHRAVAKADVATIGKLIEWGADVNLADKSGNTAIVEVLTRDDLSALKEVFWAKFSANDAMLKVADGKKPLWEYLYEKGDMELLSKIFAKTESPLQLATADGRTVLDLLSEQPEDSKFYEIAIKYLNGKDFETIRKIAELHRLDLLQKTDTQGLDINAKDKDGETLLTLAVKNGAGVDFAEALLKRGVDVNKANAKSERALDIALGQKNMEMAEYLIKNGADIGQDNSGETFVMKLKYSDAALTNILINNNVDVSQVTEDGETVLMMAVKNLNLPLVKYALEKGANVNAKDANGNTALLYLSDAIKQYKADNSEEVRDNMVAIIKTLAEHGAEMNVRNESGRTLLILAAIEHPEYYAELQQAFVAVGGVDKLKDQYGKTAEEYLAQ